MSNNIITEYEEITNGKTIPELEKELEYQLSLGYEITDNFPQFILDCITDIRFKEGSLPNEAIYTTK